ncbi:hypothetical protein [Marinimicrobium sp. C2-29]|uniref:hypothetical protein n=1 Tax=Marinimicrobium sp. C2-29 TaxID=3139825 RepID=UPI0031387A78
MSDSRLKLVLLSNIDYRDDEAGFSRYISALFSLLDADSAAAPDERPLNGNKVFYRESEGCPDLFEVDTLSAIDRARGLSMKQITGFSRSRTFEQPLGDLTLHTASSELLYDTHGCFLLVTEVELTLASTAELPTAIAGIFAGRDIAGNLGLRDYLEESFSAAAAQAARTLQRKDPDTPITAEHLQFSQENTLPLLLCDTGLAKPPGDFQNEERLSAIPHPQSLGNEYPGAFFHPGWNYTLACGFPFETFVNIVQVMVRCQTFFFSLTQIKRYFAQEFSQTLRGRDRVSEQEVDSAERVRLAFYDLLSNFNAFKNKLFPKYHDEAVRLLERWHCDDDIANIKEYIELNFQAKNRLHNAKVERQNERQNKALAFIAALQVIALYGAFTDGLALFEQSHPWFIIGSAVWLITLYAFLLLSGYIKTTVIVTLLFGVGSAAAAVLGYLPPLMGG